MGKQSPSRAGIGIVVLATLLALAFGVLLLTNKTSPATAFASIQNPQTRANRVDYL